MSNALFPSTLRFLSPDIKRTSIYSTSIQTTVSGKEIRTSFWANPKYEYEISFSGLQQDYSTDEVKTLTDFYDLHVGSWDSFLFLDPVTNLQVRVRFSEDSIELNRLSFKIWETNVITLVTVF